VTGVDAKMPEKLGAAVNLNRHRVSSFATLPALIDESAAARVPARSPFGSGHAAGGLLPPPQPETTSAAKTASGATRPTVRGSRTSPSARTVR
jgi:hypothetical protein